MCYYDNVSLSTVNIVSIVRQPNLCQNQLRIKIFNQKVLHHIHHNVLDGDDEVEEGGFEQREEERSEGVEELSL